MTAYAMYTSVRGLTLKRLLEGLLALLRCAAILFAACEEILGLSYTVVPNSAKADFEPPIFSILMVVGPEFGNT